jgi:hypothetical protein
MFLACLALRPAFLPPKYPLNRARMEQIENGMTREEVEAVLSVPPGKYTNRIPAVIFCRSLPTLEDSFIDQGADHWICDEGELYVLYDQNGLVRDVLVQDAHFLDPPPSPFHRLRRKLGL